jgi:hypothetical protein
VRTMTDWWTDDDEAEQAALAAEDLEQEAR